MILATDLDGTFLGGTDLHKKRLYSLLHARPDIILIFVTGRGLQSVMPLLNDPNIPRPSFIICDVGATVLDGSTLEPVQPLQSVIQAKWPGHELVDGTVRQVYELLPQPVPQTRRSAYFYEEGLDISRLEQAVTAIGCELIISAGRFVDILPAGVNKGSTLSQLVSKLGYTREDVLVAGDTLNDLSLYKTGYKGVVVGEAEDLLLAEVNGLNNVFIAADAGAGGILEAIRHFPAFQSYLEQAEIRSGDKVV